MDDKKRPAFAWKDPVANEAQRKALEEEKKRNSVDTSNGMIVWGLVVMAISFGSAVLLFSAENFYLCSRRCGSAHAGGLMALLVFGWAAWGVWKAIAGRLNKD